MLPPIQNLLKCSCLVQRRTNRLIRIQRTPKIHQNRRHARLLPLQFCNPKQQNPENLTHYRIKIQQSTKRTNLSQQNPIHPSNQRHQHHTRPRRSYPSLFPLPRSANRISQKALQNENPMVEGPMIESEIEDSSNPRKWRERWLVIAEQK